jgi:hypothetical protein
MQPPAAPPAPPAPTVIGKDVNPNPDKDIFVPPGNEVLKPPAPPPPDPHEF